MLLKVKKWLEVKAESTKLAHTPLKNNDEEEKDGGHDGIHANVTWLKRDSWFKHENENDTRRTIWRGLKDEARFWDRQDGTGQSGYR